MGPGLDPLARCASERRRDDEAGWQAIGQADAEARHMDRRALGFACREAIVRPLKPSTFGVARM